MKNTHNFKKPVSNSSVKSNNTASTSRDSAFNEGMDDGDDADLSRVMDITVPEDSINMDESIPKSRSSKHSVSSIRQQSRMTLEQNTTIENESSNSECLTSRNNNNVSQTTCFNSSSGKSIDQPPVSRSSQPPSRLLSLQNEHSSSSGEISPQIPVLTERRELENAESSPQIAFQDTLVSKSMSKEIACESFHSGH